MATTIPDSLKPYVPPSYYQGGTDTLKPGVDVDGAIKVAQGVMARAEAMPPAQKELFLAMVASGDIAPNGEIPKDIDGTLASYEAASKEISTSPKWRDSLEILARLMVEQAGEQRHNALQDRLDAREQAKTELLSQAQSLFDQAKSLTDGAEKAMILSMVFSAISIVASVASVAGGAAGSLGKVHETSGVVTAAGGTVGKALYGSSQGAGSISGTMGQVGQSSSGYTSTTSQATAKEKEAQGQIDAAEAQTLQAQADIKKEAQDAFGDMIKAIMNFLKEMGDAKAQQMQALTKV